MPAPKVKPPPKAKVAVDSGKGKAVESRSSEVVNGEPGEQVHDKPARETENGTALTNGEAPPCEQQLQTEQPPAVPVKGIEGMPKDLAKAYLQRLAAEMLERAAAL